MEFEDNGLKFKLYKNDHTASFTGSVKDIENLFIPKFVEFENEKYVIKKIDKYSIKAERSLLFPDDSEVESFEFLSFYSSSGMNKIQIPASLKYLKDGWGRGFSYLTIIEVSPKNKIFAYIDNQFLVGKSEENSDSYDILYLANSDIENATIPPQIKIVKTNAFNCHEKLKYLSFPSNPELKVIEKYVFSNSPIQKLVLPANIEEIDYFNFLSLFNLVDIEISKNNKFYSYVDQKYLLKKSDPNNKIFDILVFARKDLKEVIIPYYI